MDVRRLTSVTDFFVVCTATSPPQMKAIREAVDEMLRQAGQRIWHVEGTKTPATPSRLPPSGGRMPLQAIDMGGEGLSWLLMDCGDVVVHVLNPSARLFYQLERLWGDAPHVPLDYKR